MPLFTGDYNSFHVAYQDRHTQFTVATADTATVHVLAAKSADRQIFVQRIFLSVTTFANKTLTFQDTANTPVVVAAFLIPTTQPTAAGQQNYQIDFGPHGFALTAGKGLDMTISAAGVGAAIVVDAYEVVNNATAVAGTN